MRVLDAAILKKAVKAAEVKAISNCVRKVTVFGTRRAVRYPSLGQFGSRRSRARVHKFTAGKGDYNGWRFTNWLRGVNYANSILVPKGCIAVIDQGSWKGSFPAGRYNYLSLRNKILSLSNSLKLQFNSLYRKRNWRAPVALTNKAMKIERGTSIRMRVLDAPRSEEEKKKAVIKAQVNAQLKVDEEAAKKAGKCVGEVTIYRGNFASIT